MQRLGSAALIVTALVSFSGCASIVSGRHAQVKIDSYPQNAYVSVRNQDGDEVAVAQTPAVVSLKRGRTWFRPSHYTATINKPGYETAQVPIRGSLNPWLFGNVVFGGVAGLAIDSTTGAGWRPTPDEVRPHLTPLETPLANPSSTAQQPGEYDESNPSDAGVF